MAKKLNGIALNEKGSLKQPVRQGATECVYKMLSKVEGVEKVEGKNNVLVVEFTDLKGNTFYSQITITTSLLHPNDKAEKKSSHKPKDKEIISWE